MILPKQYRDMTDIGLHQSQPVKIQKRKMLHFYHEEEM